MSNAVRLYRFYNIALSKYGEPFALCDKHAKEEMQNPPPAIRDGSITRDKWADKSTRPCERCDYDAQSAEAKKETK